MRLKHETLEAIKKKFGVDRVWSYSRLSTFVDHPWDYRWTYLEEERIRCNSIYTYFGSICHEIVQDMYDGKYPKEEMPQKFEEALLKWRLKDSDLKFMNEKVERSYIQNLTDYFERTSIIPYQVINEDPVGVRFHDGEKNIVFIGYMDSIFTDDKGIFHIVDYKTSSKGDYTGKRLKAHSKQLQLYAIGIHQSKGIPYDKILPQFDMMKYYKVFYLQQNGKWKDSIQERTSWVKSQEKKIRKLLSDEGMTIMETDILLEQATMGNTLEYMPEYVKERFRFENCYIDVEINEEIEKEIEGFVISNVNECLRKEQGDWDVEFPEPELDGSNEFYYTVLAKDLLKVHKGYQESLKYKVGRNSVDVNDLDALFS